MSIAMERFGSNEQTSELAASSRSQNPAFPYRLQCRTCGFEPFDAIAPPQRCPKCAGHSWERYAFPRSLLAHIDRRVNNNPALRSPYTRVDAS
jgi:hypothetical protein